MTFEQSVKIDRCALYTEYYGAPLMISEHMPQCIKSPQWIEGGKVISGPRLGCKIKQSHTRREAVIPDR